MDALPKNSDDTYIFARTNRLKFFGYFGGCFAGFVVLYLIFSKRSLEEVFSLNNWMTPSTFSPVPILSILIVLAALGGIIYQSWSIIRTGEKYLWASGGLLYGFTGPLAKIDDIDPKSISTYNKFGPYLFFRTKKGKSVKYFLMWGIYDQDKIVEELSSVCVRI